MLIFLLRIEVASANKSAHRFTGNAEPEQDTCPKTVKANTILFRRYAMV
jgi:hypothetical protein